MTDTFTPFDEFDQDNKFPHKSTRKIVDDHLVNFVGISSLVAGPGISIDSTDPKNPIITAIAGTSSSSTTASGNLWVKGVAKQAGQPSNQDVMYVSKNIYGGVQSITGDCKNIRLTIGCLPAMNNKGATVTAYAVPGDFTPSFLALYPEPEGAVSNGVFVATRVNDEENTEDEEESKRIDHLEFYVDVSLSDFDDGLAKIVVLSDSGAYVLLDYTEENIAHLDAADITTEYSEIAAYRTGFTKDDVVTLSFESADPVYSILVWPFDATSNSMSWKPTEYVLPEAVSEGTVEITIEVSEGNENTAHFEGKLRVAASRYGQPTSVIQTTSEFVFDQRTPNFSNVSDGFYAYPAGQSAIKGTEQCTVTISSFSNTDTFTVTVGDTALNLVTSNPHTVSEGTGSFTVTRDTGESYNGQVNCTILALNHNNGKTKASVSNYTTFDLESGSFSNPVVVVNSDNPVLSYAGTPTASSIQITSYVKLKNPSGLIDLDELTSASGWSSPDGGYTWNSTVYATDSAARGESSVNPGTLTTAAGTEIDFTGTYTISGFDERAVTITTPFSDELDMTGIVDIDYPAGVTVKDMSFNDVDFTVLGNVITFTNPDFYNSNATGTLFVYVAQESE